MSATEGHSPASAVGEAEAPEDHPRRPLAEAPSTGEQK